MATENKLIDTPDGILTETVGRELADPEMYQKDIDERITKIRPMATPVDQISRFATLQQASSFEVKYYSVGTRPVKTTLITAITANASATSVPIEVADPDMFTLDDTIRVVGIKAVTDYRGTAYDGDDPATPDLCLCVCGKTSQGQPIVYAVNGNVVNRQNIGVPGIPANTTLIRMGKSCGELDVQTGRFNNLPTSELQYCQNFMAQIEQSTLDKIANKEVNWGFSDLEEDSIYDMRLAMENSFLFGDMNMVKHTTKDGMAQWFTKGIWWQAGKDIEVGTTANGVTTITDNDLVDISRDLFVGTGIGVDYPGQILVRVAMAAYNNTETAVTRLSTGVSFDDFNIVCIDPTSHRLQLAKVGSQYTRSLMPRIPLCIDYQTKEVLFGGL